MRYRPATTEDLDLLAEWNHQMIADQGHDNPMTVPQLRERMAAWLEGEHRVGVFEMAGNPVAYSVWRLQDNSVFLRHLYVARAQRRKGIGRHAVELLLRDVFPRERCIVMEVLVKNTEAIAFWRAVGFKDRYLGMERKPA